MKVIGVIAGILLMISGGYCFMHPALTFGSLGWLIGASILVYGIGYICAWKEAKNRGAATAWELVTAILAIVLAILILVNVRARLFTDMILVTMIGVWLLTTGILRIMSAVKLKHYWWGVSVVWGIVIILTAVVSLMHPIVAIFSLGWCIAIGMVTQGLNLIIDVCCKTKENL